MFPISEDMHSRIESSGVQRMNWNFSTHQQNQTQLSHSTHSKAHAGHVLKTNFLSTIACSVTTWGPRTQEVKVETDLMDNMHLQPRGHVIHQMFQTKGYIKQWSSVLGHTPMSCLIVIMSNFWSLFVQLFSNDRAIHSESLYKQHCKN